MALTAAPAFDTQEETNPFRIAMSRFDAAAELLGIELDLREVLRRLFFHPVGWIALLPAAPSALPSARTHRSTSSRLLFT